MSGEGPDAKRVASVAKAASLFPIPNYMSLNRRTNSTVLRNTRDYILITTTMPINHPLFSSCQKLHYRVKKSSINAHHPKFEDKGLMVDKIKKSSPIICTSQTVSRDFCTTLVIVKRASQVPRPSGKPNCKLGKRSLVSAYALRC